MNKFTDLQKIDQVKYIDGLTLDYNLSTVAIEKDWWIIAVLRTLFALSYAEHLSFKGGTSLSKCYNLMRETMIYGDSVSFNDLIDKIKQLNEKLNQIDW